MTVNEFIEKLRNTAKEKGLLDAEIGSIGSGQCTIDDSVKVYHYYALNVEDKKLNTFSEQIRVYTDYDANRLTMEQILSFDYESNAYTDDERVVEDILTSLPLSTKVIYNDLLNDKEYEIETDEREAMCVRHGTRTVLGVTGDKSCVTITVK